MAKSAPGRHLRRHGLEVLLVRAAGHDFVDGEFPEGDFFWISALKEARSRSSMAHWPGSTWAPCARDSLRTQPDFIIFLSILI